VQSSPSELADAQAKTPNHEQAIRLRLTITNRFLPDRVNDMRLVLRISAHEGLLAQLNRESHWIHSRVGASAQSSQTAQSPQAAFSPRSPVSDMRIFF
jgi:hypothetical protein